MMLLKLDSVFASSATAGKGFNLTVKSVGAGNKTGSRELFNTEAQIGEL